MGFIGLCWVRTPEEPRDIASGYKLWAAKGRGLLTNLIIRSYKHFSSRHRYEFPQCRIGII
jgi:hypothetical protein